jgi:arabinan endo-1,5-alpha-L-arabinosidase
MRWRAALLIGLALCSCQKGKQMEKHETNAAPLSYPTAPSPGKLYDVSIVDDESRWTVNNVHDPAIFKDGDTYYLYSTDVKVGGAPGAGGQMRSSKDLIAWKWEGRALDGVPAEAQAWSNATGIWAPDIIKLGGTYHLYYSASTFGSQRSCIGQAVGPSPLGPFAPSGLAIKTDAGEGPNGIDPNPVLDAEGNFYLVYGSFFGGIYIIKMDKATGLPAEAAPGTLIAKRNRTAQGAIEGPYVVYNPEFKKYYLFASYDSLFSDYNIRVARADRITGPYLDANGVAMTDTERLAALVGYKLMGGYGFSAGEQWLAPGHNSVLHDGDDWYLVHHARGKTDKNWPYLHVRKLLWSRSGWPLASPERYAGEREQSIGAASVHGEWEVLVHDPGASMNPEASAAKLAGNGKISGAAGSGSWKVVDSRLRIKMKTPAGASVDIEAGLLPAWDWENARPCLVFTGIDREGVAWWGKRVGD